MTIVRGMGSIDALSVALSCTAYRLLAWLAQTGEVLFDAQQDATGGGLDGGALLVDIHPTGVAPSGHSHERRPAGVREIVEGRFDQFHRWTSSRLGGAARNPYVPAFRPVDRG